MVVRRVRFRTVSSLNPAGGGGISAVPVMFAMVNVALPRGVDDETMTVVFVLLKTISVCLERFICSDICGIVLVGGVVV